jgi:hypothetical protein
LAGLRRGTGFLFALPRFSHSLGFSLRAALLIPPFLRLPELFHLARSHLPLRSFESFPLDRPFRLGLSEALLIGLPREPQRDLRGSLLPRCDLLRGLLRSRLSCNNTRRAGRQRQTE